MNQIKSPAGFAGVVFYVAHFKVSIFNDFNARTIYRLPNLGGWFP